CLAEHPLISRLAADGLPIYAIDHRDTAVDVAKWLKRNGNPYTAVGFDPNGRVSVEWGVTGVPETFIINADGVVIYKHSGPMTPKVLKDKILPKIREARE
ncbi:MAG: redoxin family protein, partial [Alphaproteobacteria bacterium]|nr:redoxin family protein [Alphaproteobacteria bacterium]